MTLNLFRGGTQTLPHEVDSVHVDEVERLVPLPVGGSEVVAGRATAALPQLSSSR